MKTLYRLLALLLLASISHQLNAAPPDNDAGQSAIIATDVQPAPLILYHVPDLQTADLSPDIGYTLQTSSNSNNSMTYDVSTRHAIKPNLATAVIFSGKMNATNSTAGTPHDWGARTSAANQNYEGGATGTNAIKPYLCNVANFCLATG